MNDVRFGPEVSGLKFGLRAPFEAEAGGTILLELVCENVGPRAEAVFGFAPGYPRSLRVSPPKPDRPYIRVSFGDTAVLHPPDAFVIVPPGARITTSLDLSFVFDRRGAGLWPIAFAYDPVRAGGRVEAYRPTEGVAATDVVTLAVTFARSLREAGVDEATEARLDASLSDGSTDLSSTLRALGRGGAAFAARRVARLLAAGTETATGFRALDALARLGDDALVELSRARAEMPHAEAALTFAEGLLHHRRGDAPSAADAPFVAMLDRLAVDPSMRGNFLLGFTPFDSDVHGMRRMEVLGNGERLVASRAPGAQTTTTRRSSLSAMQLRSVFDSLRYGTVWLLRPLREHGLADEPRPALEVQLGLGGPFQRHVVQWNAEWRFGPAAQLADLLSRLAAEGANE